MTEVRTPEVILHRRPRATRVDVCGAKMGDSVAVVDRPEVDAVAGDPARVRDRLMQVGSGKQDEPGRWTNYFDRVGVDLLLGLRLLPGIGLDVLDGFYTTSSIPLGVIIDLRIILDGSVKVFWIKSQAILGCNIKYWQPPINLTHRRRVPSISVRMKGVGNPRGEVRRRVC